jgi:hypothetical protein
LFVSSCFCGGIVFGQFEMVSFLVWISQVGVSCRCRVVELMELLFVIDHSYWWLAGVFWVVDIV